MGTYISFFVERRPRASEPWVLQEVPPEVQSLMVDVMKHYALHDLLSQGSAYDHFNGGPRYEPKPTWPADRGRPADMSEVLKHFDDDVSELACQRRSTLYGHSVFDLSGVSWVSLRELDSFDWMHQLAYSEGFVAIVLWMHTLGGEGADLDETRLIFGFD